MEYGGIFSAVNCNKTLLRKSKVVLNLAINHRGNKPVTNTMIDESEEFMWPIHPCAIPSIADNKY
jgi:hypothetical protein